MAYDNHNLEGNLVLSREDRIKHLAKEGYKPERVQMHVIVAPGDEALLDQLKDHFTAMTRTEPVECTFTGDHAGGRRGGLDTHDINHGNEAERIKTADMVFFLKGPKGLADDHAMDMLQLATQIKDAYNNDNLYRTVPINFVSTAFNVSELDKLLSIPDNAISETQDVNQRHKIIANNVMPGIKKAAANIGRAKGLGGNFSTRSGPTR